MQVCYKQRSCEIKKTTTMELTLLSEGDISQFQELINKWPPECPQQTRVEIFREKYRSHGTINVSFFTIQTLSACEYAAFHFLPTCSTHFRHTTAIPATRGGSGRLFEARRLFSIFAFRMGAYSR